MVIKMQNIYEVIENPEIFKINRLDAHSDHVFYEDMKTMEEGKKTLYHSLNGMWKFQWSKNLAERPEEFYQMDYDLSEFGEIPVPSHIELNGWDQIHYTNTAYPWDGKVNLRPPYVDKAYNPVGSYVTFFDLPENFVGKEVCISLQGVEQGFSLFLNGEYVGYSEDSFTPSDFDLTPFIKESGNRLCVEVYKKTAAAWIEDQDFFRFSGIFRDVVLYAKPSIHIEDLWVLPRVEDNLKDAKLEVKFKIKNLEEAKLSMKLQYNGENIFDLVPTLDSTEDGYVTTSIINLGDVRLWDISQPNLYSLVITVSDQSGKIIEVVAQDVGFRHFVIRDEVMYLNGERLIICGVNRHEWNPRKGRSIDETDMLEDIEVLKRNNITAVRTSHYPNQSLWYQLCDENGIIVMDETNLESHGSWQKMMDIDPSWNVPGSIPEWKENVLDRAASMFERDKNHPSILWWSCGNESYAGSNILAMANYFREKDSSRYVHYESCFYVPELSDCTDVYSRMYATPTELDELLTEGLGKPAILCEYMHNMGNSIGGMETYIDLIDKYPSYQGGFIWDYMDQALYGVRNNQEVLLYGGDFADRPSDYNFSGNGIVFADRTEKPAMQDVKFWYDKAANREKHMDENAKRIHESAEKIQVKKPEGSGQEQSFEIIYGDVNIGVKGAGFSIMFSKNRGGIVSLVYDDYEWLYRESKPTYWRAVTENDTANGFTTQSGIWNLADKYATQKSFALDDSKENELTVSYVFDTLAGTESHAAYTVYSDGTIKVKSTLKGNKSLAQLPLFGMRFITHDAISHYDYVGYSGETYPDRYKGGSFGEHKNNLVKNTAYLVPQENGCHMYNHMLSLIAENKKTLNVVMGKKPFQFNVLPNTAEELENATHHYELPDTGRTVVSILAEMRGVGGIDTWGSDVEEAYHVRTEEDIELEFYIRG